MSLSAVVMQELAVGARTPEAARHLQRSLFEPFERRGRVFAPSAAAFVESGRIIASLAAHRPSDRTRSMEPEINL
jgi:hypothetical protein